MQFLVSVNSLQKECWDWQVTVCFYTALHLINAHVVKKTNYNYVSHGKVDEILNPYKVTSIAKLDEAVYLSYVKLLQLSRRARYLLNENFDSKNRTDIINGSFTYSKHLKKSIYHLDIIIDFINTAYNENFDQVDIKCLDLNGKTFKFFKILQ